MSIETTPPDSNNEYIGNDWVDDDSEDVGDVPEDLATSAVVTDTDWTTETILSQLRRGNIQLNPRFQRRDAWTPARKSRFIESLIVGLPVPQIVLAEDKRRRGAYIVLDGKQRLLTLSQFAAGSSLGTDDVSKPLRLSKAGLDIRHNLQGYSLARLEEDHLQIDDLNAFLNQTIRTTVVRHWPTPDFLNLVFLRLNTGSLPLSPQELRQALQPGPFTDFVDDYSSESRWIRVALRNPGIDFRMRDVELLLRYLAFRLSLPLYRGNLKQFFDLTTAAENSAWDSDEAKVRSMAEEFDASIEASFRVFNSNAFFRWDGELGRYERRFNRALFDAVMFIFASKPVREKASENPAAVEAALKDLCETDARFVRYIQSSTKSMEATLLRIKKWREKLAIALAMDIPPSEQERDYASAVASTSEAAKSP